VGAVQGAGSTRNSSSAKGRLVFLVGLPIATEEILTVAGPGRDRLREGIAGRDLSRSSKRLRRDDQRAQFVCGGGSDEQDT
jgi:hypothetical protein